MSFEVNKEILSLVGKVRMAEDTLEYLKYVPTSRLLEVLGYHKTTDKELPNVLCFEDSGHRSILNISGVHFNLGNYRMVDGSHERIISPVFYVRINKPLLGVMPETLRNDLR